jgi:glycosyltransferase involved in cell wall biosynthesis
MRKLLLVSHRPMTHGGVGTVRWNYFMRALPEFGWEVADTVSARQGATTDEFSTDPRTARLSGARARVMHGVGRTLDPVAAAIGVRPEALAPNHVWGLTGRRAVRAAVERVQPDVVVATSPPPAAIFAATGAGLDVPVVADMRDLWAGHPHYDAGGQALTEVEDRALKRAAAVVCVTPGMEERLRGLHPWLEPVVMPNGFDPRLLDMRGGPRSGGERKVVIHPGTLFAERSVRELVEALRHGNLAARVRLSLVGNMNEESRAALAGAPPELEIDVAGPKPWEETIERMAAADVVAVIVPPGLGDDVAWPVKQLEALALGKPILLISSGGGAERQLRDLGLEAGAASYDDPGSIAPALERLLDDPPPPVAPERLSTWDRRRVTGDYAALLDSLAG